MRLPRPQLPRRKTNAAPVGADPPTGEHPITGQGPDGVRDWLAQLDRKLRLRTLAAGLVAAIALGAGAAGVLLALDARDNSATKEDLNEVRTKITSVEQSALRAAADDIEMFSGRIESLENKLRTQATETKRNRAEIRVASDDIEDLRRELSELSNRVSDVEARPSGDGSSGSGGGGTGGT